MMSGVRKPAEPFRHYLGCHSMEGGEVVNVGECRAYPERFENGIRLSNEPACDDFVPCGGQTRLPLIARQPVVKRTPVVGDTLDLF